MLISRASFRLSAALAFASVMCLTASAYGQSPPIRPGAPDREVSAAEKRVVTEKPRPVDLEDEVAAVKAENAAVRAQLRKMEEQQKTLLELMDRLQRRLDGPPIADTSRAAPSPGTSTSTSTGTSTRADAPAPSTAAPGASAPSPSVSPVQAKSTDDDRYQDGIVIWRTSDDAEVPFLLKFNVNTQVRYLNTLSSPDTFTDHLGAVHEVHRRNDITVNRSMFILGGYVFDKRLRYSMTVWTSAGAASIV